MLRTGSWCGETHIQKATLLLQDMMGVDSSFEFILYRHGPFSFDLRYELSSMQADNLLELTIRREGYGPTYAPTRFSEIYLERFPKTTSRYIEQVRFVAGELGDKGVADLEKLATAFFIFDREGIVPIGERAERLVDLKPHISLPDARSACEQVDRMVDRASPLRLRERDETGAV
jgi:hypothetical protein